jgi:hypothetical protein
VDLLGKLVSFLLIDFFFVEIFAALLLLKFLKEFLRKLAKKKITKFIQNLTKLF